MPPPENLRTLRSFLGATDYYVFASDMKNIENWSETFYIAPKLSRMSISNTRRIEIEPQRKKILLQFLPWQNSTNSLLIWISKLWHKGHPGKDMIKSYPARSFIYWSNLSKGIEHFGKQYDRCLEALKSRKKSELASWSIFQRLQINFAGMLMYSVSLYYWTLIPNGQKFSE